MSASRLRSPSHDNLSSVNNNTFSNHRANLEKDVSSSLLFFRISGPVGSAPYFQPFCLVVQSDFFPLLVNTHNKVQIKK